MRRYYFKKAEKVQHIESIVADLETRLEALKGDKVASQLLAKENRAERTEVLENHINNLNSLHQYINSFFDAWLNEQKELNK